MKLRHSIYIAPLLVLAACNSEKLPTAGHPDGAIELRAGLVEGSGAVTKAGAEDNHTSHLTLTENTKLALRVSGTWTGHDPSSVVKTTTATVGSETSDGSKHNSLSCSPVLYWDDYGTADPANAATGRADGLTIYGVAINGKTDAAPSVTDAQWTSGLPWTLTADQTGEGNKPADKDLLISNNLQASNNQNPDEDDCGTYKFINRTQGKLLEFRHALSKITVNLKAGEGFNDSFSSTTVQLTSNEGTPVDASSWPIITGKVDITNGNIDITSAGQGTHAAVTMHQAATTTDGYTVTKEALVMPGSAFKKDAIIARINADGNIYYVTSAKIREAINATAHDTDDPTESGKNYVINVIVNKTAIEVTATVTDWVTVTAAEVAPKINITVSYGVPGTAVRVNTFSFYRSLTLNDGYATGEAENLKFNNYYKRVSELTKNNDNTWTMNPVRYWSNHNQHFQFRLVWPNTTTALKEATENPDVTGETVVQKWRPHVEDKEYSGTNYQVIEIWNDPFQEIIPSKTTIADDYHPYPSNLAIARPEIFDDPATTDVNEQLCTNKEPGHTQTNLYTGGICATEGKIDLKFRFIMSQVEVNLTTSSLEASRVELENAKVEIVNAYKTGDVKLGDREVIPTGTKGDYEIDPVTIVEDDPATDEVDENIVSKNKRHSAIVPQPLEGVKFRITITNTNGTVDTSDDTTDVYYADVAPIKKSGSEELVAPNGAWESGVHYVYNLNVSKTQIKATATLANWTTVEATEEVWF